MILFLLFSFFLLSLVFYYYFSKNTSVITTANVFVTSIIIFSFIPIIYIYNNNGFLRIDNGTPYTDASYFKYIIYVILTLLFLFPVHLFYKNKKNVLEYLCTDNNTVISNKVENLLIILSILISLPLILFILQLVFQHGFAGYIVNRIILLQGSGYLISLIKFPQIAIGIIFYSQMYKKHRLKNDFSKLKIFLMIFYSMFLALIMGSRSQMFIPIISLLIIYLIIIHRGYIKIVDIKKPLIIIVSLLFIAISLGQVRESIMADKDIVFQSEESTVSKIMFTYGSMENLLWLFEHDNPKNFENGSTFLAALTGFIPRTLWQEKLLGGGPIMKNLIVSGSYNLSSGTNISSTTTGVITESYMNFSWLGVLFPSILLIALNATLKFLRFLSPPVFISFYSFYIFNVFGYSTSEFFGVTAHLFMYTAAAVFFDFMIRVFSGKIILFR